MFSYVSLFKEFIDGVESVESVLAFCIPTVSALISFQIEISINEAGKFIKNESCVLVLLLVLM